MARPTRTDIVKGDRLKVVRIMRGLIGGYNSEVRTKDVGGIFEVIALDSCGSGCPYSYKLRNKGYEFYVAEGEYAKYKPVNFKFLLPRYKKTVR